MRHEVLKNISRVVIKLGTGVLTDVKKQPDLAQMELLVAQLARLRKKGLDVVVVTSGAVGAGMGVLGHSKRPTELAELQACAAVGQSRLMATYERLFGQHQINVAQVLLTHEDLEHHERHLNARNTLVRLLHHGIIPIINENDAVSFTEIKFGDNDKLSALVACLLPADLLIILTTIDGVVENFGKSDQKLISVIKEIDQNLESIAGGTTSATAVGGMISKIQAAKIVIRSGVPLVIASGHKADVLAQIIDCQTVGTLFIPKPTKLRGRKRWIAFFHHPKGSITVDDGAKTALREKGRSLLPPGVLKCDGDFSVGDVLRICDADGTEFARGIVRFSVEQIKGGNLPKSVIIHRDDLVII